MKGVRFYLEYNSPRERRKNQHAGTVFAAFVANGRNRHGGWDGIGSVLNEPNSTVASTGTSFSVQHSWRMKPISEATAREIHPRLFRSLDIEYS